MISRFQTFRDLLLYCLKCHDEGKSEEALSLINDYLTCPEAKDRAQVFWSEYNIEQAMGFRIGFLERANPSGVTDAVRQHSTYCLEQTRYWLAAAADSSARLALMHFKSGDIPSGREAAVRATRFAATLGSISHTVLQATEEATKHGTLWDQPW